MRKIRTVLGDIPPEQLGATSMHEHTMYNVGKMKRGMFRSVPGMIRSINAYQKGDDIRLEADRRKKIGLADAPRRSMKDVFASFDFPSSNPAAKLSNSEYYINELKAFAAVGGQALCDCSPMLKPPSRDVQVLSRETGIHIVIAAGFYTKPFIPLDCKIGGEEKMKAALWNEIQNGDGTSDARPGFLKCAIANLDKNGRITSAELQALRSCGKTAKETGMSLHIHNAFPLRRIHILQAADILQHEIGLDPQQALFCHMDSFNTASGNMTAYVNAEGYDAGLPLELLNRGFNIGLDTWKPSGEYPKPDFELNARTKLLRELLDKGFAGQITLGHDFMSKPAGIQNGGMGYTFLPHYLRRLIKEGFLSDAEVSKMVVENPARILAF